MYTTFFTRIRKTFVLTALLGIALYPCLPSAQAQGEKIPPEANPRPPIQIGQGPLEQINKYFTTQTITYSDGTSLVKEIINGPPTPPSGYELERVAVALPEPNPKMGTNTMTVPAFNWVFGCSSVSGAMIAGYYDRNGFPNMYTGPTDGGIMPLNNSSWPTWSDGYRTYPNLPLAASHNGVDGRTTRGSIDDYWVQYESSAQDPYITNGWTQHTWGNAIGDYMKTSQSAYGSIDGSTSFWNYNSASQLTCNDMETFTSGGHTLSWNDGTYGRKLFYEARGYTVTTCYNQPTDNKYAGGFSFAQYKAEIDAGRPVMLNLAGHTIVGVGYDDTGNTAYVHDTWDYSNHTMAWGGSYSGMELRSVSIVNLQPTAACTYSILPATRSVSGASGSGSVSVTASDSTCAWTATSNAAWITVTSGSSGTGNGTVGYSYTALSPSTERTGLITIAGKTFTLTQTSSSECPDCPGDGLITNAIYRTGTTCACSNATAITLGSDVTVENGATVTFTAPKVTVQPGFHGANGSTIYIKQ